MSYECCCGVYRSLQCPVHSLAADDPDESHYGGAERAQNPKSEQARGRSPEQEKYESRSPDGDGQGNRDTQHGDSADGRAGGQPLISTRSANATPRSSGGSGLNRSVAITDESAAGSEPADSLQLREELRRAMTVYASAHRARGIDPDPGVLHIFNLIGRLVFQRPASNERPRVGMDDGHFQASAETSEPTNFLASGSAGRPSSLQTDPPEAHVCAGGSRSVRPYPGFLCSLCMGKGEDLTLRELVARLNTALNG